MTKDEIRNFLIEKPGYQKFGKYKLSIMLDADIENVKSVLKELRGGNEPIVKSEIKHHPIKINTKISGKKVLVIGDLHLPFSLNGYLEHCINVYNKYECDEVVFIGDILDLHYSSYHETHTDAYGATEEHDLAVKMIKPWYKAFPKATVTIGNHDALIYRKAMTAGISKRWIQDFSVALDTPGWDWVTDIIIDNVIYTHGTTNAYTKAKQNLMSTVQGHLHSQAGIQFFCGHNSRIFGFQIGCGIDSKSYAMEYGRNFPKPIISCGVVVDGINPYLEVMNL